MHIKDCIIREDDDEQELQLEVQLTRRGVIKCQSDLWLSKGLKTYDDGSGSIRRSMKLSFVPWAASYFLSLGKDAAVLQPKEVRSAIRDLMQDILPYYEKE